MIITKEYSMAYVEVLEVLKGLSKEEFNNMKKIKTQTISLN